MRVTIPGQTITVLFNGCGQKMSLPVPAGRYSAVLRGLDINQHGLGTVESKGSVDVAGNTALVLVQ